MGTGTGGFIDIMFLVSGIYLIYTAVVAKKRGNVADNVMLGKNMGENNIGDKAGFLAYMYKRIMAAGVIIITASVIHIVNDYYIRSAALTWVGSVLILAAMAIYVTACLRGRKRFLSVQKNRK